MSGLLRSSCRPGRTASCTRGDAPTRNAGDCKVSWQQTVDLMTLLHSFTNKEGSQGAHYNEQRPQSRGALPDCRSKHPSTLLLTLLPSHIPGAGQPCVAGRPRRLCARTSPLWASDACAWRRLLHMCTRRRRRPVMAAAAAPRRRRQRIQCWRHLWMRLLLPCSYSRLLCRCAVLHSLQATTSMCEHADGFMS